MSAIWCEVMESNFNKMLDVLDEDPRCVCKFHFGEEFNNVILGDVASYVDNLIDEAMKNIDACFIRCKISNENGQPVMSFWYEEDQRVVNGKIVE